MGIKIKGIAISSLEAFRQYFDFSELYDQLEKDSFPYENFVKEVSPAYVRLMLFGLRQPDGKEKGISPVPLLKNPEKCASGFYSLYFEREEGGSGIRVRISALTEYIGGLYRHAVLDEQGKKIYIGCPKPEEFEQSTERLLNKITDGGKKRFSPDGAAALFLCLHLHIQAGILPEQSYDSLQKVLERNRPVDVRTENPIIIRDGEQFMLGEWRLPDEGDEGRMQIVQIVNRQERAVTVSIGDSVLRRRLNGGEALYAIRQSGHFLYFLPRFSVLGDTVLLLENGKLCAACGPETRYLNIEESCPACWAHSNVYGTLVINKDGKLNETCAWPEKIPDRPAVSVSAWGEDYCLLLEDGHIASPIRKKGWEQEKFFLAGVGQNGGAAVGEKGTPVLADGTKLTWENTVSASVMEKRYICMNKDGEILTDSGLSVQGPVYAAAVCPLGYVLAGETGMELYNFRNERIRKWDDAVTTEIAVSDRLIAYYDSVSGLIRQTGLT